MRSNPYGLEGKSILITGASSGIGRATAVECSRMGASQCILVGRRQDALEETRSLMHKDCEAILYVCDLAEAENLKTLAEQLPAFDGIVLNAGINRMKPLQFYSESDLDSIFSINCFSPILLLRHLVKKKRLNRGASVVFTASISGHSNVSVGNGVYGASKSALTAFMRYAALELAPRQIRCNAVHPGRVITPLIMSDVTDDETIRQDIEKYPLKRYGNPEEVAYSIIYLLSDAARWVTGANLVVDGGRSLV